MYLHIYKIYSGLVICTKIHYINLLLIRVIHSFLNIPIYPIQLYLHYVLQMFVFGNYVNQFNHSNIRAKFEIVRPKVTSIFT